MPVIRYGLFVSITFSACVMVAMGDLKQGASSDETSPLIPLRTKELKKKKKVLTTMLSKAVQEKQSDSVVEALKKGASPTVIMNQGGESLLHKAIQYSAYREALILAEAGASQTTVAPADWKFLTFKYPYTPLLLLLNKINEMGSFILGQSAATNPDVPLLIHALIDRGAELKARTVLHENPLHLIAHLSDSKQKIEIAVKMIGSYPYMINAVTSDLKRSPLFNAVLSGDEKYVEFLIKKGAAVNACDSHGRNSLMVYVSEHKNPDKKIPDLLAANLLNLRACDREGRDVVWYASFYERSAEFIHYLKKLCSAKTDPSA